MTRPQSLDAGRDTRVGTLMSRPPPSTERAGQSESDEEVLLCFGNETNRRMLATELRPEYRLSVTDSVPLEPEFALCIVDEQALEQYHEELQAVRQASEPIIRPCLLVTSSDTERIDPSIWETVDDIITTPISIAELRPRIESLLRLYRLSVESANRRQLEEVASVLSHDLRSPLNTAQGHLELAREGGEEEHFDRATRALDRIEDLISDVLTLVCQDYSPADFEPISVEEVARESWDTFRSDKCTLEVKLSNECSVRANRSALKELFSNLYRNANDHNEGPVAVTIGPLQDGFYVADDGTGIPDSKRDRIFESGYTTESDGTGLGLSIIKQVADAHGWDVSVTTSEQGGAQFEVRDVTLGRMGTDECQEDD